MRQASTPINDSTIGNPGVFRVFFIVAHAVAVLVLVQAILAGRWLKDTDIIEVHGYIGSMLIFPLAIGQLVLAWFSRLGGRNRTTVVVLSAALLVLILAQVGLGYAGRDSTEARANHLPLGVLIFGLTTYNLALLTRVRREG